MCVRRYNYSRDDEEVYKEFLEIANEMIPNIMRTSSGDQTPGGSAVPESLATEDKRSLTGDPECYAMVLQFYDGLCEWEEGSSTPVLHITWAQHALYSLGRFDYRARAGLMVKNAAPSDDDDTKSEDSAVSSNSAKRMSDLQRSSHRARGRQQKTVDPPAADDSNPDANTGQASTADVSPSAAGSPDDKLGEQTTSEKIPSTTEGQTSSETVAVSASLVLRSVKMMGMKDLLVAERLNSGAIKLQLTAQSQVHVRHSRTTPAADYATSETTPSSASRKRIRRE